MDDEMKALLTQILEEIKGLRKDLNDMSMIEEDCECDEEDCTCGR